MTDAARDPDAKVPAPALATVSEASVWPAAGGLRLEEPGTRAGTASLRNVVVSAGIAWSILFVVIGLRYGLQMYGDGSIFSYAVAAQDAWAFHWHNISGRLFVYLFCFVPAEAFVELTGSAGGGVAVYGFLFFAAQLIGLIATYAADRSPRRIIFVYACLSTACLCPLVFGFPTEMWMAHALFWPTLAVCHYPRPSACSGEVDTGSSTRTCATQEARGFAVVFALMLALVFTHGGAIILGVAILASLLLRGRPDAAFMRAAGAFLAVIAISVAVEFAVPPDPFVGRVLHRAALHVFDIGILGRHMVLLLFAVLAAYGVACHLLRRFAPRTAQPHSYVYAALLVAAGLAVYWLGFDHALLAEDRYPFRTILIVATPLFGFAAAAHALHADGRLALTAALTTILKDATAPSALAGAVLLVTLVHAVETAKFTVAWTHYKEQVRALAMGDASDPALGNPGFVSSDRIPARLNRLSWFSTTHYLSILVAPALAPKRFVVDPHSGYVWLTCPIAIANEQADRAVPLRTRALVRQYVCLHRLSSK
jgi:hypothetical protein